MPTSLRYSLLASAPFIVLGLLSRPSFVVARWWGGVIKLIEKYQIFFTKDKN